jgi:hypothetical protein
MEKRLFEKVVAGLMAEVYEGPTRDGSTGLYVFVWQKSEGRASGREYRINSVEEFLKSFQ